jgi:hypothetical protein
MEMFKVTPPNRGSVIVRISSEIVEDNRLEDAQHVAESQIAAEIRGGGDNHEWLVRYAPEPSARLDSPPRLVCVSI